MSGVRYGGSFIIEELTAMRTRLLYLIAGALLAAGLIAGASAIRGQSAGAGTRWEYAWVDTTGRGMLPAAVSSVSSALDVTMNDAPYAFDGALPDLFNKLGADGWEYVDREGLYFLFKRPLP
jgi:hypothetical protein